MITDESLQPHRFVAQILQRGPENRNRGPLMRSSCFQLTFITPPGGVSRAKAWTTFTLTPFSFSGQRPKAMRSKAGANPEGCQTVAGGRTGQGGERPPEDVFWDGAPRRGARRGLDTLHPGSHDRPLRNQSGTPAGVQVNSCAAIRRSPPPRPPSTSGYPLPTLRVDKARMSKFQRADRPAESAILLATHPHRSHTTPMGKERNIAVSEDSLSDFARERLYMI